MKKSLKFAACIVAAAGLFGACGDKGDVMNKLKKEGFTEANPSMYYKVTEEATDGKTIAQGDIVLGTITFRFNDSILEQVEKESSICMAQPSQHELDFSHLMIGRHVGEHISVAVLADSLAHTMGGAQRMQNNFPMYTEGNGDAMYYDFVITNAMTEAEYVAKLQNDEAAASEQEAAAREQYLKDNNITAKPSATGLYRIITQEGNGKKVAKGNTVSVHYTGRLLDGTKFDSSLDRNEPISLQVGAGQVIKGWEEGLEGLKEGTKATLIIPSDLAYGQGNGPIPPFSTLVFDVEVVSVK